MILFFNQSSVDKTAKANNFPAYPFKLFPLGVDMPSLRGESKVSGDKLDHAIADYIKKTFNLRRGSVGIISCRLNYY